VAGEMMRHPEYCWTNGLRTAAAALTIAVTVCLPAAGDTATNVILFIGDGMGPEQVRAARYFKGTNLCFEGWARHGEVRTHSANSLVTESAAAGTAMATGHKAHNGVVSVAIPGDGREYETVLEYLRRKGKRTGLVTTTFVTDATPAVFGAHEVIRSRYAAIAADYFHQSRPNVLFGGGGYGLSVSGATTAGYAVVTDRLGMQALDPATETMVSGQFGLGNMPYEYEGLGDLPHLSEMTETALRVLEHGPHGFFLMVEGGRIDHACHGNDIVNCVRETVEFDHAVHTAQDWASNRTDTLLIVTADHECGGLTVLADNGPGHEPDVEWSSAGHTGTNVGVYAQGPGAERVTGVMDNTDIYRIMMQSQPIVPEAVAINVVSGGGARTSWNARPGDTCRLDAASRLLSALWVPIETVTAETHEVIFVDTNEPTPAARFYRLAVER
jgi:alkaline phosphatase